MNIKNLPETDLIYRFWQPEVKPRASFLLIHGLGAHSGRWHFFGEYFAERGFASYALELKGFGETSAIPGHIWSFETYFEDIKRIYGYIKKEHPANEIFLAGESLGALISFLMASRQSELFSGLICFSPAFKNRMKFSLSTYLQFVFYLYFFPIKQFKMPFNSQMCTRDAAYQKEMDSSWRETRVATARMLWNILKGQISSAAAAGKVTCPVLFLLAGEDKDQLVVPAAAKKIFKKIKTKDKQLIEYSAMLHALSIELEREKVFEDVLKWVNEKIRFNN
jgi:alpha-beta hydrolase superfamily lysophospholipase